LKKGEAIQFSGLAAFKLQLRIAGGKAAAGPALRSGCGLAADQAAEGSAGPSE